MHIERYKKFLLVRSGELRKQSNAAKIVFLIEPGAAAGHLPGDEMSDAKPYYHISNSTWQRRRLLKIAVSIGTSGRVWCKLSGSRKEVRSKSWK